MIAGLVPFNQIGVDNLSDWGVVVGDLPCDGVRCQRQNGSTTWQGGLQPFTKPRRQEVAAAAYTDVSTAVWERLKSALRITQQILSV